MGYHAPFKKHENALFSIYIDYNREYTLRRQPPWNEISTEKGIDTIQKSDKIIDVGRSHYKHNNMITKLVKELNQIIREKGYWSKEVKEFNSKLDYVTMIKINQICKRNNSHQTKCSN